MTDYTALSPVGDDERIQAMDVLRGFALLGILLMNIEAMVGPMNGALTGLDPTLTGADRLADALIYILVQGKFYPLFSLLFGMGFAVMMARSAAAGRPFVAIYARRVLALLAIGLAHALLVWSGDILTTYALVAVVLLVFFRNTPQSRLPKWAVFWILVPPLLMLAVGALLELAQLTPEGRTQIAALAASSELQNNAHLEAQRLAQGEGSYAQAVAQRVEDLKMMLGYLVFWGWQILGLFLLGAWFVRSGAIARPSAFDRLYARLRWVALPLGLAMTLLAFRLSPTLSMGPTGLVGASAMGLSMLGGVLMCLGYLAWIVRGLQSPAMAPKLGWLAPAGRMALTNYLLQSLVCTWIFSGYGLGYFEQLPRAWQVPFVLGFYTLQVLLSHAWLSRFRYGPAEWLWRAATYLRLPDLRH
jgi:uncharacterized protein